MLSQSSISSKRRKTGTAWAQSFLGVARHEPKPRAVREASDFDDPRVREPREDVGAK